MAALRTRLEVDTARLRRLVVGVNLVLVAIMAVLLLSMWRHAWNEVEDSLQTQAAFWANSVQQRYDLMQATCNAASTELPLAPARIATERSDAWFARLKSTLPFVDGVRLLSPGGAVLASFGDSPQSTAAVPHRQSALEQAIAMGGTLQIGRATVNASVPGLMVDPVRCALQGAGQDAVVLEMDVTASALLGPPKGQPVSPPNTDKIPAVGMLSADGHMLARRPPPQAEHLAELLQAPLHGVLAQEIRTRPTQLMGLYDGIVQAISAGRMIGAWQRLDPPGVVTFVSLPHSVPVDLFWHQAWPLLAGYLLLLITQLVAWFWILRMIRHQRDAARLSALLADVNQAAGSAQSEPLLFQDVCKAAATSGRAALAWIGRTDKSDHVQVLAHAARSAALDDLDNGPDGAFAGDPALRERIRTAPAPTFESWRRGHLAKDSFVALLDRRQLRTLATLPLRRAGHLDSVLLLHWRRGRPLEAEHQALLHEVADSVNRGLERLDLLAAERLARTRRERQQELLQSILAQIDILIAARSDAEVLESVCSRLLETGLFTAVWIGRADNNSKAQVAAAGGEGAMRLQGQPAADMGQAASHALARAWRSGHAAEDHASDSTLIAPWTDFAIPGWEQSVLALPLRRRDAVWAVLVLVLQNHDDLQDELRALLQRVTVLVERALAEIDLKTALESERAQQRHLARHDALTGLPNRLALEQHLPLAMARARRTLSQLAVGVMDLDDFKPINDRLGHAAGDQLLKTLAQRLRAAVRETDLVVRLGGDEFVVVLEGLDSASDLPIVLARICDAVENPFDLGNDIQANVGLTLGLTLYPQDESDADVLLRHADAALYAGKANKSGRSSWWYLWGEELEDAASAVTMPLVRDAYPYGPEAGRLLEAVRPQLEHQVPASVDRFYDKLRLEPGSASLLTALSSEEFDQLRNRQVHHLLKVLSPDLSEERHQTDAEHVGQVHALVGLSSGTLVTNTGWLWTSLLELTERSPLRRSDRAVLAQVLGTRLQRELQWESLGMQHLRERYQDTIYSLDQSLSTFTQWVDLSRTVLDTLVRLPGMAAAAIFKPDSEGHFIHELTAGIFDEYFAEMSRLSVGTLELNADSPLGLGPHSRCWRSEQIETNASYFSDPRLAPWRQAAHAMGIRSSAAVPLKDGNGRMLGVVGLYGRLPAMFEGRPMLGFMRTLEQFFERGTQAILSGRAAAALPAQDRRLWRQQLFNGGLELHYQPIVDLRSGKPTAVEALARLRMPDGSLVSPGLFLPSFGVAELTLLFTLGLDMALDQLVAWDAQALQLDVALNLPTAVLVLPECAGWVADALTSRGIDPGRLRLEVLEDADVQSDAHRDHAVRALAATGIKLVMDDLGSGYSSLLRLRTLPFHTVKIDQGLVREIRDDSHRAVEFIGGLIGMTQALGLNVVVEGLETDSLVEIAAALGADAGQGYALAHPIPAAEVRQWCQKFVMQLHIAAPISLADLRARHRKGGAARQPGDDVASNSIADDPPRTA